MNSLATVLPGLPLIVSHWTTATQAQLVAPLNFTPFAGEGAREHLLLMPCVVTTVPHVHGGTLLEHMVGGDMPDHDRMVARLSACLPAP
jgi:hypothetical protein